MTEFLTGLGVGPYGVLALIMLMYLVLGCLMDAVAMIILTVPIIFPVINAFGFDPIWFGVIIVMTVELGLIHPPVGTNVFVIKSVAKAWISRRSLRACCRSFSPICCGSSS